MYVESSEYYDLIYKWKKKNYKRESDILDTIISKSNVEGNSLLDVACGTSEHHRFLKHKYVIDGIDINDKFLEIAKNKNPDCQYYKKDMIDFNLGKQYDIITCLFSSIGYVKNYENLLNTIKCFYKHIKDKGILIIEPWFTPENFHPDTLHMNIVNEENLKLCRIGKSVKNDNLSIMEMHYLVGKETEFKHFSEIHKMALFTIDEMIRAFETAGFFAKYNPKGITDRGVYIAKKKIV
jgi:ubiquinone/menaquinone biosynthesis C-methylase UbiE